MKHYRIEDRSGLIGILLVIFGGLFLMNNFDLFPHVVRNLAFNWRGILFVVGVILLVTKPNKMPGTVMLSIAVYLMVGQYVWNEFGLNIGLSQVFWPGMMMIAGYILLKKKKINLQRSQSGQSFDYLSDSNIMGGGEVKVQSQQFKGGHVTALFGGAQYDMSGSKLAEGRHTLEVFAIFGGFTFVIPSDWDVHLEVTAIFGGIGDQRKYVKPAESTGGKVLRIKGFVLFGGGELRNY